jgi:hypothetical protein
LFSLPQGKGFFADVIEDFFTQFTRVQLKIEAWCLLFQKNTKYFTSHQSISCHQNRRSPVGTAAL